MMKPVAAPPASEYEGYGGSPDGMADGDLSPAAMFENSLSSGVRIGAQSVSRAGTQFAVQAGAQARSHAAAQSGASGGVGAGGPPAPGGGSGSSGGAAVSAGGSARETTVVVDAATAAIDGSSYSSLLTPSWIPLVAGLPDDQQAAAERELSRPIAAAEMLADAGQHAAAATAYINANPALKKAIETAGGGKANGEIDASKAKAFASQAKKQLNAATGMLSSFRSSFPYADDQSLQLARSAAVLRANMSLTNAAALTYDATPSTTMRAGLLAIVTGNPGFSPVLISAANTFSRPGMFRLLALGGLDGKELATKQGAGSYDDGNIDGWVKKQAPVTGGQFASAISGAAAVGAVADVDTSKLNADVFNNSQNYLGAQKAAVLIQLQEVDRQVQAGASICKVSNTTDALQQRIDQLRADPSVQAYLQQAVLENQAAIVNSDPALAAAVQKRYAEDIVTGAGLQSDLASVDGQTAAIAATPNADEEDPQDRLSQVRLRNDIGAVNDFSSELRLQSDLGRQIPTLAQAAATNPGVAARLGNDYTYGFAGGGDLRHLLAKGGPDPATALKDMQSDEGVLEQALSPDFLRSRSAAYASSTTAAIVPALIKSGSGKQILSALLNGPASQVAGGAAVFGSTSLSGQAASPLGQSSSQAIINAFLQDLKSGKSLQDALAKYDSSSSSFAPDAGDPDLVAALKANPQAAAAAHALLTNVAASALLANAASGGNKGGGSEADSNRASEGAMYFGYALMPPGLGAGIASFVYGLKARRAGKAATAAAVDGDATLAASKGAESAKLASVANKLAIAGESIGVVGGALTAALTLPAVYDLIRNGQSWDAAQAIAGGTRGLIQATTGVYDLAAAARTGERFMAGRLSSLAASGVGAAVGAVTGSVAAGEGVASAIAAGAGPAGWIIDGILFISFLGEVIGHAVVEQQEKNRFGQAVNPTLTQYGLPKAC